jgi:hypothetical protein
MLNVLPWGRPALSKLYHKTAGKVHSHAKIYLNAMVINNLSWLAPTIPNSIGICFVDAGQWSDNVADFVLWTDASGKHSLAFVFTGNGFAYQLQPSSQGAPVVDFFSSNSLPFFPAFTMLAILLNCLVVSFFSLIALTL